MKLDEYVPVEEWNHYNKTLSSIIEDPKAYGFDDNIIPVCQFLAYFCPVNPPCENFANMSSFRIVHEELSSIVEIDINTVSRLMLRLGYQLYYNGTAEWSMMRALFE